MLGSEPNPLIWAHGFGTDQQAWLPLIESLPEQSSHFLFDHVGCGNSDNSAYSVRRYNSLYSYANDLLELLSAFSLSRCTVIAHSVSGMVALLASLLEPDAISRVIALSASPRYVADIDYPGAFTPEDLEAMFQAAAENYRDWVSGFAPMVAQNPDQPQVAAQFAENLRQMRPDIALPILRMILESDHRKELPEISAQAFFLQPASDPAVPVAVGRYLQAHVANSELKELAATGHLPHLSAAKEVRARILEVLWARDRQS